MTNEEIADQVDEVELKEIKKHRLINEPFWIALLIVVPFIAITIWLIYDKNLDAFKDIASVWGVWVGTVLGYYFGSRPTEALTRKIGQVLDMVNDSGQDYERQLDEADEDLEDLQTKYDNAVRDIQYIVLKYPSALDKPLIERLKADYEVLV
jgi:hypothetical protein